MHACAHTHAHTHMLTIGIACQLYLLMGAVVRCRAMQCDSDVGDSTELYANYDMHHVTPETTLNTESIEY